MAFRGGIALPPLGAPVSFRLPILPPYPLRRFAPRGALSLSLPQAPVFLWRSRRSGESLLTVQRVVFLCRGTLPALLLWFL